jgi:hypothetical protein
MVKIKKNGINECSAVLHHRKFTSVQMSEFPKVLKY